MRHNLSLECLIKRDPNQSPQHQRPPRTLKELRELRGFISHPMRLQYKKCFCTSLFLLVYKNNNQSVKVSNYFDFYHCNRNIIGCQNRLKIEN